MNLLTRLFLTLVSASFLQQCQRKTSDTIISVDEVYAMVNDSARIDEYVLLDTRSRMEYVRGHLISSIWLSPDSIASKIGILARETRPFIIYDSGSLRPEAADMLLKSGVSNFHVMAGGFSEWTKRGYPAAIRLVRNTSDRISFSRRDISADETYAILQRDDPEYVIIDIRSYPAFEEVHVKGALSVPYVPVNEFVVTIEAQDFSRNRPIILYGDAGADLVEKAAEVMLRNDFSHLYVLQGGIGEWTSKNYPVE